MTNEHTDGSGVFQRCSFSRLGPRQSFWERNSQSPVRFPVMNYYSKCLNLKNPMVGKSQKPTKGKPSGKMQWGYREIFTFNKDADWFS